MKRLLSFVTIILLLRQNPAAFRCYTCQGGYATSCATTPPQGVWEDCTGNNAQCYQSVKYFQSGAIQLIERRCWVPPAGNTSLNYCKSFNNPNGQLIYCETCKTDLCNGSPYNPKHKGNDDYFIKT